MSRETQPAFRLELWLADSEQLANDQLELYCRLLSKEERLRYSNFKDESAKRQFLLGRAILKTRLASRLDIDPARLRLEADRYGRLSVANLPFGASAAFNLSHTGGLVACAIGLGGPMRVGVDVERVDRRVSYRELEAVALTSSERTDVALAPEAERDARFLSYWTLKEAYLKARGLGLSGDLHDFSFDLSGAAPRLGPKCREKPGDWSFWRLAPTPNHTVAVASSPPCDTAPTVRWFGRPVG